MVVLSLVFQRTETLFLMRTPSRLSSSKDQSPIGGLHELTQLPPDKPYEGVGRLTTRLT
ncbi:hypothetical protein JKF63_02984 [Porcisia hertigi]|uniref:Uncharacterized protein n=1 Tax=Porcisia hertigi TaxID=2761500 RepID=A0A836L698_9TRYP|nr:hypothetical protein JKF63_02984 [Porcisia hertigi]